MNATRCAGYILALLPATCSLPVCAEHGHYLHAGHHHDHFGSEPIGVTGAHTHATGQWMLSYRVMRMEMEGNRDGTDRLSTDDVLARGYSVVPQRMIMDMHMFGAMYGVNEGLTFMAMLPYLDVEMDHVTGMDVRFTTATDGIGDMKFSGIYRLARPGNTDINLNAGISVPTGSFDERDDTPMGNSQPLPYSMQLGSGTWDLLPGITVTGTTQRCAWGVQASAVIRLGENDNEYTLGNRYRLTGWLGRDWTPAFSTTLRLGAQWWDDIDGSDSRLPAMMPMMVPTADPDLRGGERYDLLLGAALTPADGMLMGHRFAAEFGRPLHQDLDGPQLETDWTLTFGWQWLI